MEERVREGVGEDVACLLIQPASPIVACYKLRLLSLLCQPNGVLLVADILVFTTYSMCYCL